MDKAWRGKQEGCIAKFTHKSPFQPPECLAISDIAKMSRYFGSDARSQKDLLTRGAYIYGRARQKTFTALAKASRYWPYTARQSMRHTGAKMP